jgi:hypothetical protein
MKNQREPPYSALMAVARMRHRTVRSKGCLSNRTALAMICTQSRGAQKDHPKQQASYG